MGQAIQYARKGSTIILVAVFAGTAQIDLAVLNDHELDLNTSMMYRNEDYLDAIRLVKEKKVVAGAADFQTFRIQGLSGGIPVYR